MGEVAARGNDDDSVSGLYHEREKAAMAPSSRRITADSFRLLAARLRKSSDSVQEELRQRIATPEPMAVAPVSMETPHTEPAAATEPANIEPVAVVEPLQPVIFESAVALAPPVMAPSPEAEAFQLPKPEIQPKPEASAKARAEAHAFAMEAIAKLRKAAGVAVPAPEPEPVISTAPAESRTEIAAPETMSASAEVGAEPAPAVAAEVATEAAPAPVNRKPHPFFPDVFIDEPLEPEAEVDELPEVEAEASAPVTAPEVSESFIAYEPVWTETADEGDGVSIAEQIEAQAEIAAPSEIQLQPHSIYEETEIEVEQLPVEAVLVTRAPEFVAEPAAETIETAAANADEDAALREQNDLIEDEADAVKHLHGVEVVGIGDIAKAIFRNPTAAERAAFLEEVAELARQQKDAEQAKEILAVEIPESSLSAKPQVRKIKPADDPFARVAEAAPEVMAVVATDEDAGELARSLLDMMLSNPNAGLPQERALAADALLKLIPRVPVKALVSIVERLSIMDNPPHLLIARLINDPRPEIAGPLLEQCNHISDQLLGKVITTGQVSLQRLIARRRHLSSALADQLVDFDDPSVVLTLVRNTGAVISHPSFRKLAEHAVENHQVLAPLATRADLPAPIAFELFWHVPAELRRYLLSRFLTDSETLTKILKITNVMDGGDQSESVKFAEKEKLDALVAELEAGNAESAATMLAEMATISEGSARRIIADRDGEPMAIALKAVGANRAQCEEYVERLKAGDNPLIKAERQSIELQNVFDQMSFNKARVLLTYWDWAVLKSGPYSAAH
jgi:uncharacterized protein (DUF2336 family)